LELSSVHEILTKRNLKKRCASNQIDLEKYEEDKKALEGLHGGLMTKKILKF